MPVDRQKIVKFTGSARSGREVVDRSSASVVARALVEKRGIQGSALAKAQQGSLLRAL